MLLVSGSGVSWLVGGRRRRERDRQGGKVKERGLEGFEEEKRGRDEKRGGGKGKPAEVLSYSHRLSFSNVIIIVILVVIPLCVREK